MPALLPNGEEVSVDIMPVEPAVSGRSSPETAPFLDTAQQRHGDTGDWRTALETAQWDRELDPWFEEVALLLERSRAARLALCGYDLAHKTVPRQQTLTALHAARHTEQLRHIFARMEWDARRVPSLHAVLLDTLSPPLLHEYVDLLRFLRAKVPEIVQSRLLDGRGSALYGNDPRLRAALLLAPDTNATPLKAQVRLREHVVVVLVPCDVTWNKGLGLGWRTRLAAVGTTISCGDSSPVDFDTAVRLVTRRVADLRAKHPEKMLVLAALSSGCKVAVHVAQRAERADCVVCLGLHLRSSFAHIIPPLLTDEACGLKTPILFATGTRARGCTPHSIDQLRLKLNTRNKLVLVKDGDDLLRVPMARRLKSKMTQPMADQMVLNEVVTFVEEIIATPNGNARLMRLWRETSSMQAQNGDGGGAGEDCGLGVSALPPPEPPCDASSAGDTAAAGDSKLPAPNSENVSEPLAEAPATTATAADQPPAPSSPLKRKDQDDLDNPSKH
eukprot:m.262614 g.262614  ORF g.262614 m.262614 type:complete len:502 (-) comp22762_c9_seq1:175-1680(-)